ncbi:hypothetical protein C2G38_2084616 [Gigaspora rosea]|uniref:Uncharacterized protein n=1 Tax=Gigaspora rosea TaxID=44941 RepID=A0A397V9Z1_9GLOM|nr:hypothetical protein C2G38_2084616 [Gigaspora rosea]
MSYPDSRIKDFLVEREIRRIQIQAQIFKNLTIFSIDRSKTLFEKDKSSFRDLTKTFLQNSNSISSFLSSELTTIKMFQESKRIRVAYHDIVKTLANVSDNFEDRIREFKIQKFDAKYAQTEYAVISGCFGVFLGFIAGMGVGSYMVSFDGGVVFLSTVLHTFKSGVQTFEKFWTGHVDFLTNVQQIIENSFKVNIDLKPINTQSIFSD